MPIPTEDEIFAAEAALIHCPDDRKDELGQAVADFIDRKIREYNPGSAPDAKICVQCAMDGAFYSLAPRFRTLPDGPFYDAFAASALLDIRVPALQDITKTLNEMIHDRIDQEGIKPVVVNVDRLAKSLNEVLGDGVSVTQHTDGILEISIGRSGSRVGSEEVGLRPLKVPLASVLRELGRNQG